MKTMKIVVNNECKDFITKLQEQAKELKAEDGDWIHLEYKNIDSKHFSTARDAKKIVNTYAVTQLPFIIISDDSLPIDRQEYAAIYSEEGPITVDRIINKL